MDGEKKIDHPRRRDNVACEDGKKREREREKDMEKLENSAQEMQ